MAQFYFNDCLPQTTSCNIMTIFHDVMSEYLRLRNNKNLQINNTLAVGETPEKTIVCGITLKSILSSYNGNRDEKTALNALFRNAIVLSNQWDDFVDPDNIYKEFSFNGRNAQYLAIASTNKMIAISLPVEDALKKDTLDIEVFDTITDKTEPSWVILNWYKDNTTPILPQLLPHAETQLDKLRNFFIGINKNVTFSNKFEDQWNNEIQNDSIKERIIKRFAEAYKCGLLFPAIDDPRESKYKIIRKDNSGNTEIFELRLRDIGVRIYFTCDNNAIFILLYGTKTKHQGHDQESDFRVANSIARRLSQHH